MSMIKKKQAGLIKNPTTRRIPPKNSVDLHKYALNNGKGKFADWSVPAKSLTDAECKIE